MRYVLGLDIGGTKSEAVLMAVSQKLHEKDWQPALLTSGPLYWQVCARQRMDTERQAGYDAVVGRLGDLCREVLKEGNIKATQLTGIGLGLPGSVSPLTHVMLNGNTGIFIGRDLRQDLARQLDVACPLFCENDANCFALAEAVAGVGLQHARATKRKPQEVTALGIILGTGVGGGCFHRGQLIIGRRGGAGEWGHVPLKTAGLPCYCGSEGCAEAYLSGPGIEAMYGSKLYSQIEARPTAAEIFELAAAQEPAALAVVKHYKRYLGRFLAHLAQVFDPDYFVLGGGVSRQDEIYRELTAEIIPHLFIKENPPVVYKYALGDSAGVIGAGLLSLLSYES